MVTLFNTKSRLPLEIVEIFKGIVMSFHQKN